MSEPVAWMLTDADGNPIGVWLNEQEARGWINGNPGWTVRPLTYSAPPAPQAPVDWKEGEATAPDSFAAEPSYLRRLACSHPQDAAFIHMAALDDAADEIERLREQLRQAQTVGQATAIPAMDRCAYCGRDGHTTAYHERVTGMEAAPQAAGVDVGQGLVCRDLTCTKRHVHLADGEQQHPARQRGEGQEEDTSIVARVTAVCRKADQQFETVGGSSRHWVRDCFLPLLNGAGLFVTRGGGCQNCDLHVIERREERDAIIHAITVGDVVGLATRIRRGDFAPARQRGEVAVCHRKPHEHAGTDCYDPYCPVVRPEPQGGGE
jgi:hypothetical protein